MNSSNSTVNFGEDTENKDKLSKKPSESQFVQQTLRTYYPVLNARFAYPIFLILSLLFVPIGVAVYFYSQSIQEVTQDYTDCRSIEYPYFTCEELLNSSFIQIRPHQNGGNVDKCNCRIDFSLEEDMKGTIYIYYALTNYYQNHLRYYRSRDENQLKGNMEVRKEEDKKKVGRPPSAMCQPYDHDDDGKIIFPCGLQANSMFFDEIRLSRTAWDNDTDDLVPLRKTGIALQSDIKKFENPPQLRNPKDPIWQFFGKPKDWKKHIWELDANIHNNGVENEDFIIWMSTAAFPNFRKLHRIVDPSKYPNGLEKGKYSFLIEYYTTVSNFKGSKSIIITNSRRTAGRNFFLASAYFATGIILFFLFVVFFVINVFTNKQQQAFVNQEGPAS